MSVMKRQWKNIRKYFIKKVTLQDVTPFDTYVSLTLSMKNFININEMSVTLNSGEVIRHLPYRIINHTLSINIPYEYFIHLEGTSKIRVSVNDKKMLIYTADVLKFDQSSFFADNKLFNIFADGSLKLSNMFPNYSFEAETVKAENITASYNHFSFNYGADEITGIALIYDHKIVEIENDDVNSRKFSAGDFEAVNEGTARVYAVRGSGLYVLAIDQAVTFNTPYYQVVINKKNHKPIANIETHKVNLNKFESTIDGDKVHLTAGYSDTFKLDSVIVTDTLTQESTTFRAEYNNHGEYTADLPIENLVSNFSRKRIVLHTEEPVPYYIQPSVSQVNEIGFNERLRVLFNSERIKIWFYERKDTLLGFKATRPKVRRLVTHIEDYTLDGYITGLDEFENCNAYLSLEERYTSESVQIEIQNNFKINLRNIDLINIKSKNKTIIDLFVIITNGKGEVIRKGKIKYQHSNYKKDNYYGSDYTVDSEGNKHFQLLTTTPYNNLKIESFMVPGDIDESYTGVKKDMNTWLVGERYDTAQDNGYAMFVWLREHTDVDAYYVIEKDSKDFLKIKDIENVLTFGSDKHFHISFKAGVLLGTHDLENLLPYKPASGFYGYEDTVKVFLQHGVLGRKPAEYHKKYYELPFDLFIVSSIPEKEDIVMKKMGYSEQETAVTGLARFDLLPSNHKTQNILLMPTWRDWITSDEGFLKSRYYHRYVNLIQNPRLHKVLEDYNVNLNFYPHYRAQVFFNASHVNTTSRIHFIELGDRTVQELLISHSLLITDYSSVSFDFSLMDKPVIYYHFDVGRFFKNGKLRPLHETFIGDTAKDEETLIDLIEKSIQNQFMSRHTDLSGIFEYQDHHNRERIYKAVLNKIKAAD